MSGSAVAPPPPAGYVPPDTAGDWHRVHPVSPLVRGWIALLAVLYIAGQNSLQNVLEGSERGGPPIGAVLPWVITGIALIVALFAVSFYVSWRFTQYQITREHVRVNSGVLFRQSRQARLDRVQAIDVIQPLLARLFGLAELKFEVADAGESAVRLAYLKLDEAKKLRATILGRAAGVAPDPLHPEDIEEAPEQTVVELSAGRILGGILLSASTAVLLVMLASAAVLAFGMGRPASVTVLIPAVLGFGAYYWGAINSGMNFKAAVSPDGIRIRSGLLDTRAQTVPPGRVQAVGISQGPLWRWAGWYSVRVNVAGYGLSGADNGRTTILPVGTFDEVLRMLSLVLPDPGTDDPRAVFEAAVNGSGADGGFTTTPRRARLLAPLAWRRNGFRTTSTALLIRSGVLWRRLTVVPHERTQSLSLEQGPLARRFNVADLSVHSTAGPVSARVYQQDVPRAKELFTGQAERAASARRLNDRDHWLEARPAEENRPPAEGNVP